MEYEPRHSHTPSSLDILCAAISSGDMATFDAVLPDIQDLDADNGRALRVCVENDQYLMAKKLMLRGADSYIVKKTLTKTYADISTPTRFGRTPKTPDLRDAFMTVTRHEHRLSTWKKEVTEYATTIGTAQKLQELEAKIDVLHDLIKDLTTANKPARIEKPLATPHRGARHGD